MTKYSEKDAALLQLVGKRIREAREAAGMTQAELAKRIGTGQSKVASYEAGAINIGASKLIQIADVFGINAGDLMK